MALASMYQQLNLQAATQAYADVYMELVALSAVMVGLAFLLSKNKPGEGPGGSVAH